jgi:hypothetical protein
MSSTKYWLSWTRQNVVDPSFMEIETLRESKDGPRIQKTNNRCLTDEEQIQKASSVSTESSKKPAGDSKRWKDGFRTMGMVDASVVC